MAILAKRAVRVSFDLNDSINQWFKQIKRFWILDTVAYLTSHCKYELVLKRAPGIHRTSARYIIWNRYIHKTQNPAIHLTYHNHSVWQSTKHKVTFFHSQNLHFKIIKKKFFFSRSKSFRAMERKKLFAYKCLKCTLYYTLSYKHFSCTFLPRIVQKWNEIKLQRNLYFPAFCIFLKKKFFSAHKIYELFSSLVKIILKVFFSFSKKHTQEMEQKERKE